MSDESKKRGRPKGFKPPPRDPGPPPIRLVDGFLLGRDKYNWTLLEETGRSDAEGQHVHKTHGYFQSVPGALREAVNLLTKRERPADAAELVVVIEAVIERLATLDCFELK